MLLYSNEYLNTWRVLSSRFFGRFRAISFSARGTDRLGYVRPLEVVERDYILAVVAANGGNRVRAAGLDHRPTCGEHDYFLGGALSPGRRSPVSRSMFQPNFDVIATLSRNGAMPSPRMRSTSCGP